MYDANGAILKWFNPGKNGFCFYKPIKVLRAGQLYIIMPQTIFALDASMCNVAKSLTFKNFKVSIAFFWRIIRLLNN